MEDSGGGGVRDDRSDSGVSSLRSAGSGDERSGSRSSALSSSDEPPPQPPRKPPPLQPTSHAEVWSSGEGRAVMSGGGSGGGYMQHPLHHHLPPPPPAAAALYSQLPELWAKRYPPPLPPPPPHHHHHQPPPQQQQQQQQPPSHPHLHHHHHLAAPQQQGAAPHPHSHPHPHAPPHHHSQEEIERAYAHDRDRLLRERREQEARESEKQKEREREKEKQEKERQERERQDRLERERLEKRAAEQAVHKHFEESLRLAQQRFGHKRRVHTAHTISDPQWTHLEGSNNMCWINSLPGPRGEEKQQGGGGGGGSAVVVEHGGGGRLVAGPPPPQSQPQSQPPPGSQQARQERTYYQPSPHHVSTPLLSYHPETQQRVGMSTKVEYPPPPAHSRGKQGMEKVQQGHTALPKAEPNFNLFSYPPYQTPINFLHHEKGKEGKQNKEPLPNPPPLMSDLKNSVIVKNSKSPGLQEKKYLAAAAAASAKSPYEYRSPSQSPHPLHPPSPAAAHYEAQNLASISKVHVHRSLTPQQRRSPHQRQSPHPPGPTGGHRQSPHPHRQSPHHHPPSSPHLHPHSHSPHPSPPANVYSKPATVTSYPYPSAPLHYVPPPTTPPKPKAVSSPAPQQPPIYSKPRAMARNESVCVTAKPLTPSPYQQLSQHNLPPPQHVQQTAQGQPPQAHATPKFYSGVKQASPPGLVVTPSFQTQPLDLGLSSAASRAESPSPKRKAEEPPVEPTEIKKIKVEEETTTVVGRVGEAGPLLATAATAITAVLNTSVQQERPETPLKAPPHPPQDSADSPVRPPSYPVHKLKKAWLQRHSGEDATENTSDVKGSGTCVTLPMPIATPPPVVKKEPTAVNSLHSIGSMAVNSITKKPKSGRKVTKELNGHVGPKPQDGDDSSSSDPERKTTPQKRVPPKVKRKKSGRKAVTEEVKRKKTGVSSTESEKESGSDKDSDSGSTNSKKKEEKAKEGGKKRGRRPKSTPSKNGNEEESRTKKAKDDEPPAPQRDPVQKPSVGQLKKTGESFLQDGPCFEVAPKLAKCRECRWTPNQRNRNMPNIFCRFYAFRRLRYTKNGQLAIAGFSDPHRDALQEDLKLWLPTTDGPQGLDLEMSRFLLAQLGDQFCDLLQQEKEATSIHMSEDKTIAWKRVVQFVREMCDVCETTLFNFHWACGKCGFVVCIDCYKGRKNGTVKIWGEPGRDKDDLSWLLCTNRQPHEQEKLMLTQIIAGDSMATMGKRVHETRAVWGIPMYCSCPLALETPSQPNGISKELLKSLTRKAEAMNGSGDTKIKEENKTDDNNSPLSWLADVALSNEDKKNCEESPASSSDSEDDDKEGNYSTLRELLIRPSGKSNGSRAPSPGSCGGGGSVPPTKKKSQLETLDEVISSVIEHSVSKEDLVGGGGGKCELKHFVRRYNRAPKGREPLPIRIMTLTESKQLYPDVPHAWLCDGKLLRLLDSTDPNNYTVFQDQWKRGQPVLVSEVTKNLDGELWNPESFLRDFCDTKNDLVNCANGNLVPNQPMRRFWEGFLTVSKRLKDDKGNPMLLKLKDWPPGDDFAEMLPSRFSDLMKVLPLGEYTHRNGRLNLASRLPDCFVRPDLGPKMYTAYGSALHPSKGTTNLHLDISDAVNVMVYVGIPTDVDEDVYIKEALRAIDEASCDVLTRRRVREKGQLPGALWHIYTARDADKIRDLLNKVAIERGARLEPHHDPIHDQSWYLDQALRDRLYKEYAVEGYSIVQCLGDAVFVPAGAPHQVRNLHNCIKVAEDFVSPENVAHCFNLTQEFRDLSDTHTNHEDKLQIKNIVYHAVKDSLASLTTTLTAATAASSTASTTTSTTTATSPPPPPTATAGGGEESGGEDGATDDAGSSMGVITSPDAS